MVTKALKPLMFFLLFFSLTIGNSQSVVQKYNSLYNRYEYFDDRGNMIGYKTYNSLLKQWEFYGSENNKRETDYGKYVPPVNLELVARVLAYKQARYDNLSYEQKLRLSRQRAYRQYQNQKAHTTNEFFKVYDKYEKTNSRKVKNGIKIFKSNMRKENKDILKFSDGWYKCFYIAESNGEPVNYERFIQVLNGNVINYVGNFNIIYPVKEIKSSSSFLTLTIGSSFVKDEEVTIYCTSAKALSSPPKYNIGIPKLFYTDIKDGGKIDVLIKRKGEYIYLGKISKYWKDSEHVTCDVEQGVIKVNLPIGDYEYYAFGDIKIWRGKFTLSEYSSCHKTKLISKS